MDTGLKCLATPGQFFELFGRTWKAMMGLRKLPPHQKISKQLAEKISLAVSGVNRCLYCSWLHAKTALEKGVSQEEINALLSVEFDTLASEDAAVVLYAQHWADRDGEVAPETREKLLAEYGPHRTEEVEAYISAVYFGNLCSNTVVAYRQARSEGRERPTSLLTYLLALPVASSIKRRSGIEE